MWKETAVSRLTEGGGKMKVRDTVFSRWCLVWFSKEGEHHFMFDNCKPLLFQTRKEARNYANEVYGYIRQREDLKRAPHFWRIPIAMKTNIRISSL